MVKYDELGIDNVELDYRELRQIVNKTHDRFSEINFDESLSLLQKVNLLANHFKVVLKDFKSVVDYLDKFIENFDDNLHNTLEDVIEEWTENGVLGELINNTLLKEINDKVDNSIIEINDKVDNSIIEINDKVDNSIIETNKKIDSFTDSFTDTFYIELSKKITRKESESISWGMLDQSVKDKFISGNSPVLEKDSVSNYNIIDKTISRLKLKDLKLYEKNILFNSGLQVDEIGGYYSGVNGNFVGATDYNTTKLISLYPNTRLRIFSEFEEVTTRVISFWDINNAFISGGDITQNGITVPSNAKYFRMAVHKNEYEKIKVVSSIRNVTLQDDRISVLPKNLPNSSISNPIQFYNLKMIKEPVILIDKTKKSININPSFKTYGNYAIANIGMDNIYMYFDTLELIYPDNINLALEIWCYFNPDTNKLYFTNYVGGYGFDVVGNYLFMGIITGNLKNSGFSNFPLSYSIDGEFMPYNSTSSLKYFMGHRSMSLIPSDITNRLYVDYDNKRLIIRKGRPYFANNDTEYMWVGNELDEGKHSVDNYSKDTYIPLPHDFNYVFLKVKGSTNSGETRIIVKTPDQLLANSFKADEYFIGSIVVSGEVSSFVNSPFEDKNTNGSGGTSPQKDNWYKGKKVYLIGDSITTYAGYVPEGNAVFYTGSGTVNSVDKTWWKDFINRSGMSLLMNESYSGSKVISVNDGTSGIERCDKHNISPDVIIVYMGINDFNNNVDIGSYDGKKSLPTITNTFREAYAIMLSKILIKYKNSEVFVMTLSDSERNTPETYPETNAKGVTLIEWNNAIKEIANSLGVNIIDNNKNGITYFNKDIYLQDKLHPNALGMKKISDYALKNIVGYK